MAGSEIYTYHLTQELAKNAKTFVFTRMENPFESPYTRTDEEIGKVAVRRINKPDRDYTLTDKYLDTSIDKAFREYVKKVNPDIVHVGHLSHLSTNIIPIIREEFGLPVIYTIHDFWLFCFRGQLMTPRLNICSGPGTEECFSCARQMFKDTVTEDDVQAYQSHMQHVIGSVDIFLSPSWYLKRFFEENGVPETKVHYSRYGFKTGPIRYRQRTYHPSSKIRFGFMGRIIPVKGIHLLLKAFGRFPSTTNTKLVIFGETGPLHKYLSQYANEHVTVKGGYKNWEIDAVLEQMDFLVVPSTWYENSPLVIQEAFLAGIPVVTSDIGGMAELVTDGVNGLTFRVGDVDDLYVKMRMVLDNPAILNSLRPDPASVRTIEDDAKSAFSVYRDVILK